MSARTRGHSWVGCEHVLLALLADPHGWPVELLGKLQLLDEAKAQLTELLDNPEYRWSPGTASAIPLPGPAGPGLLDWNPTPRLRRCLDSAANLGRTFGHDGITSEHALVALAEDEQGACAAILDQLGIRSTVIEETKKLMAGPDYFTGACVIVSANDKFVGWPVMSKGVLWVKSTSGKIVDPGDLSG